MCLAYSGLIKIGSNIGHASGRGSADRAKFERALAAYTAKLQSEVEIGDATTVFQAAIEATKHSAAVVSMNVLAGDAKEFAWNCLDNMAKEITNLTNIGKFYQVFLPNHVVCGWTSPREVSYFFDPNFGEARVLRANYRRLIGHVLGHPALITRRQLVVGAPVYLIPIY
jgi:hypothetical protein